MTGSEYRTKIDEWMDAHLDEMTEDIKMLVRIPSVRGEAREGVPSQAVEAFRFAFLPWLDSPRESSGPGFQGVPSFRKYPSSDCRRVCFRRVGVRETWEKGKLDIRDRLFCRLYPRVRHFRSHESRSAGEHRNGYRQGCPWEPP